MQHAEPFSGIGDRRSRKHGAGMEFADHRPYQFGDDIRYLDSHAYSRLRQHHVKLFSLHQSIEITILLDASASMGFGEPRKYDVAASLVAALAYVGLSGGDAVTVGLVADGKVSWFHRLGGLQRTRELFSWLEHRRPAGATRMGDAVRAAAGRLPQSGLVVVVSDWMDEGAETVASLLEAAGQELVGVQVLAPEEEDPALLGVGAAQLFDAEGDGSPLDVALDRDVFERYRQELESVRADLAQTLSRRGGRYLGVRSDTALARVLLHDWRSAGFLW